jgi:hypothetical protein
MDHGRPASLSRARRTVDLGHVSKDSKDGPSATEIVRKRLNGHVELTAVMEEWVRRYKLEEAEIDMLNKDLEDIHEMGDENRMWNAIENLERTVAKAVRVAHTNAHARTHAI